MDLISNVAQRPRGEACSSAVVYWEMVEHLRGGAYGKEIRLLGEVHKESV
jgi:hypothetical protein